MRLPFGAYAPDLPDILNGKGGCVQAKNMFPITGGYDSMRGLSNIASATAIGSTPKGSLAGLDNNGNSFLFVGEASVLRSRGVSMQDVSRVGGYGLSESDRWSFARFGGNVFAATFSENMQYRTLSTSGALFADVPTLAPKARHIATIGNFLMAGNLLDQEGGLLPESVRWCAIDNPLNWPAFGSDAAVQVQADRLPLEGNGGWVQDLVSGAEVGVIFQERAIHRLDYRGAPDVFERNRVEEGNGMFIPYSAVPYERQVFYIAEDGFRVFDYTTSHPVGKSRVSETFLADLDTGYLHRVETARDPDRTVIWIAYPGSGHTNGRPNKLILYDYRLDQFTHADVEMEGLIENASGQVASMDAGATPGDPDDVDAAADLDSYDDRPGGVGASRMGAFSTTFFASEFEGDVLEGIIETGDFEGVPDRMFWLDEVRPLVEGRAPEVAISSRDKIDEEVVFGPYQRVDPDGTISFRSDARYHRFRVRLQSGWGKAVGLDIYGEASGER
jgi:hypothetical protein